MAARTTTVQNVHDRLVKSLADKFESDGYYVKADGIGHPNGSPPTFNMHIPDIYAVKGDERIIAEAETCDSISLGDTYHQWLAFSRVAGTVFHVIVPRQCLEDAKKQANYWGIKVDHWWYLEI